MKFQYFQPFLPTLFVHPVSCLQKDITAVTVKISTFTAVFTNSFCPISQAFPSGFLLPIYILYIPFYIIIVIVYYRFIALLPFSCADMLCNDKCDEHKSEISDEYINHIYKLAERYEHSCNDSYSSKYYCEYSKFLRSVFRKL